MSSDKYKYMLKISNILFKENESIYLKYISSGKKFRHALDLYSNNFFIFKSICKNKGSIPSKHTQEYEEHLKDWLDNWELSFSEQNPEADDVFSFISSRRFKKEFHSVLNLLSNS